MANLNVSLKRTEMLIHGNCNLADATPKNLASVKLSIKTILTIYLGMVSAISVDDTPSITGLSAESIPLEAASFAETTAVLETFAASTTLVSPSNDPESLPYTRTSMIVSYPTADRLYTSKPTTTSTHLMITIIAAIAGVLMLAILTCFVYIYRNRIDRARKNFLLGVECLSGGKKKAKASNVQLNTLGTAAFNGRSEAESKSNLSSWDNLIQHKKNSRSKKVQFQGINTATTSNEVLSSGAELPSIGVFWKSKE
jgi:hypothetical protein